MERLLVVEDEPAARVLLERVASTWGYTVLSASNVAEGIRLLAEQPDAVVLDVHLSGGSEVEAYCTKCKLDRLHAIETLKSDGNINRVICRTCEGSHLFRRPKSSTAKKTRSTSKARKKGAVTVAEADLAKAKPYKMDGVYAVGDIIQHKHFGPGSILVVRPDGKMEVGFETGSKLLVCGR